MPPKSVTVHDTTSNQRYRMLMEGDLSHLSMAKVKRYLTNVTGIPMQEQRLMFNGFVIADDATGGDLGLYEGAMLNLQDLRLMGTTASRGSGKEVGGTNDAVNVSSGPSDLASTLRPSGGPGRTAVAPAHPPATRRYEESAAGTEASPPATNHRRLPSPSRALITAQPSPHPHSVPYLEDEPSQRPQSGSRRRHSEHFSNTSSYQEARSRSADRSARDVSPNVNSPPPPQNVPSFRVSLQTTGDSNRQADHSGMNVSRKASDVGGVTHVVSRPQSLYAESASRSPSHQQDVHENGVATTTFQDLLRRSTSSTTNHNNTTSSSNQHPTNYRHESAVRESTSSAQLIVSPEQRARLAHAREQREIHNHLSPPNSHRHHPDASAMTSRIHADRLALDREREELWADKKLLSSERDQLQLDKDRLEAKTRELLDDQDSFARQWDKMKRVVELKDNECLALQSKLSEAEIHQAALQTTVSAITKEMEGLKEEATLRLQEAVLKAKTTNDSIADKYIQRLKEEMEQERADHSHELEHVTRRLKSEMLEAELAHSQALGKLRNNHAKDMEELIKQHEDSCGELESQLKKEKRKRDVSGDRHEDDVVMLRQQVKELTRSLRTERSGSGRVAEQLTSQITECGRLQTLLDLSKKRERELEAQLQQNHHLNSSFGGGGSGGTPTGRNTRGIFVNGDGSPGVASVTSTSAHAPTAANSVEASLRHFSQELKIPPLRLGDNQTCVVHLDEDNFSAFITFDPATHRLFLYATLLNQIPTSSSHRLRLYEELLEGSLLGREMAGGGIGISRKNDLVLISVTVDVSTSTEYALASIARPFLEAVRRWQRIVEGVLQGAGHRTADGYASVSRSPEPHASARRTEKPASRHREIYSPPPPSNPPALPQTSPRHHSSSSQPPNLPRGGSISSYASIDGTSGGLIDNDPSYSRDVSSIPLRKRTTSVDLDDLDRNAIMPNKAPSYHSSRHRKGAVVEASPDAVESIFTTSTTPSSSWPSNGVGASLATGGRHHQATESVSPRPSHANDAPRPTSLGSVKSTSRRASAVSTTSAHSERF